jgi:hypothetical protein
MGQNNQLMVYILVAKIAGFIGMPSGTNRMSSLETPLINHQSP